MPKTCPQQSKLNLGDRAFNELEDELLCQVKGATTSSSPQNCSYWERFDNNGSRVELLIRIRVCEGPALL